MAIGLHVFLSHLNLWRMEKNNPMYKFKQEATNISFFSSRYTVLTPQVWDTSSPASSLMGPSTSGASVSLASRKCVGTFLFFSRIWPTSLCHGRQTWTLQGTGEYWARFLTLKLVAYNELLFAKKKIRNVAGEIVQQLKHLCKQEDQSLNLQNPCRCLVSGCGRPLLSQPW